MLRTLIVCLLIAACSLCGTLGAAYLRADEALSAPPTFDVAAQLAPLEVPPGFVVEIAAAPPLVRHPMMATFDDRGRLFIAENAGVNLRPPELETQLPNFIRLLEDTDGDGRFDKSTIFADKMTFPQGGVWHDGSLYVASSPNIWKLTDTDGDGVADQREILVSRFGYNGNAADIHGCFLGPDGRLYWCDGRHGHEFQDAAGNVTSRGKAARIFSCRTDGSDVQVHCGGGMDNPVEIDFMPNGDMLGTVNLLYKQRGDCLVHWLHGGVYPREDQLDCLAEFKRTGDLLGPVYDFGHVAVSGMTRFRSNAFGDDFLNNVFVTEFNTGIVQRVKLAASNSTYQAESEPFFRSKAPDFHPTDVLEDADGSLLVVDTGGWFRIGCPTSQIAKPNILGAIYRIRRTDAEPIEDPRGLKLDWATASLDDLVRRLGDKRFAVRERAIAALAAKGPAAAEVLHNDRLGKASPEVQRGAIWALTRQGTPAAQIAALSFLHSENRDIVECAQFSAGQMRNKFAVRPLMFRSSAKSNLISPTVRRTAATALGKIGDPAAVPALLAGLTSDPNEPPVAVDPQVEHSIIYALIEIADPRQTRSGLKHPAPRVQRGALLALDQMERGELQPDEVLALLSTDDADLRQTALQVISRHPDWAPQMLAQLRSWLTADNDRRDLAHLSELVVALTADEEVQALIGELLSQEKLAAEAQRFLLDVVGNSRLPELPTAWEAPLRRLLASADASERAFAVHALAAADWHAFDAQLLRLSDDERLAADARETALLAAAQRGAAISNAQLARLIELFQAEEPARRLAAARALGTAELTAAQREALDNVVASAGALELPALLRAFRIGGDLRSGENLLAALRKSPGTPTLTPRALDEVFAAFPDPIKSAATSLPVVSSASSKDQELRLAEVSSRLGSGDPSRGKAVFQSQRATCSACHRVDETGGQIGPNLTGIAKRRTRRDLLEAILFPSASLARDFESHTVATSDGLVFTGLILRQTGASLLLRTTQQTEVRIDRSDIEELIPSPVSIMPHGLERTLTDQQLADLLAYLESLK